MGLQSEDVVKPGLESHSGGELEKDQISHVQLGKVTVLFRCEHLQEIMKAIGPPSDKMDIHAKFLQYQRVHGPPTFCNSDFYNDKGNG